MNVLIPLVFALILINYKKIRDDQDYRFSVFSVVGIAFFFVLKFVDYYFSIFNYPETHQFLVRLVVVLVVVGICLSPLLTNSNHVKTGFCISLFAVSVILAFAFDRPIKIVIANTGGYFDKPEQENLFYSGETREYVSENGGYSLLIPAHWDMKKKDDLTYFVISANDSDLMEFRTRCFHDTDIVITEVIQGLKKIGAIESRKITSRCFREGDIHTCLVKSVGVSNTPRERWHLLSMNARTQQNIELDVLLFNDDDEIKHQVHSVFASITINILEDPKPNCPSPIDWF